MPPFRLFLAFSSGLLSIDIHAQAVTASAVAHTVLTVTAGPNTQTLPAGTVLTGGVTLSTSYSGPGFPNPVFASASTAITLTAPGGHPAYHMTDSAQANGLISCGTGSHQTVWRLSSTQPIEGTLTVRYMGGTFTNASVDVFNDSTMDWTATTATSPQLWRATITVSALTEIRTQTSVFLGGSGSLDIDFRPHVMIHDQGPIVTHVSGGSGGADVSALQNAPLPNLNNYGFNANNAGGLGLADDFAVGDPAGWDVEAVEVIAYQTGAATAPSTLTGLFLEIYAGDPSAGGLPVSGSPGITTNLLAGKPATNAWSGAYRTQASDVATATNRPLMRVRAALPALLHLPQGIYWIQYRLTGSLASGPWVLPLTVWNRAATGDAKQVSGATWVGITSGTALHPQGIPFRLFGYRADPMGSIATLSPGCGDTQLRVTGAPVVGGFLHAELSNLAIAGLPLIGLDLVASATPFCGCTVGHGWAVILFGTVWDLNLPMTNAFAGLPIVVQGSELWGNNGCSAPQITFTETVKAVLR